MSTSGATATAASGAHPRFADALRELGLVAAHAGGTVVDVREASA
ncbi:hypothetical protein [Streptomyces sp. B1I3]|nr:hypothetical protein [Streptomyces sp. B1I3]MDQ0795884.1 hypothetical protein [Streptomyces sp. B1I3]